jgi:hemoglobin-like flavoprotein
MERLAEYDIDITPQVYQHFFESHPHTKPYFRTGSQETQGHMLYEVINALINLAEGRSYVDGLMATMVSDHTNYGPIQLSDYLGFLDTFQQCLQDELRQTGASEQELASSMLAWRAQIDHLEQLIRTNICSSKKSVPE